MGMRSGCALALLLLTGVSVCGQEMALEPSDTQANPFASHDFGQVAVGSNASYTYSPINLLNAPSLKAGAEFSLTPATSSSYILNFTPRYPGLRSDSILASGVTPVVVPVKGLGVAPQAVIWPGVITTLAGGSLYNTDPNYINPAGMAVDLAGNIYFADIYANVVRRIDASTGSMTIVAGNGTNGNSGDGGPALSAQLSSPNAIAFDLSGNLYIADSYNYVVRKVDSATGMISRIAGTGARGASAVSGAQATAAALGVVMGVAVDSSGDLFLSDLTNSAVYKLAAGTSTLSLYAGTGVSGYSGDGGVASSAMLRSPAGLAIDSSDNLYIAEFPNVRRVAAATQLISTVAGSSTNGSSPDGTLATAAQFTTLSSVSVDAAGDLYIPDSTYGKVRIVSAATGLLSTMAGGGYYVGDYGPATSALLNNPVAAITDAAGNIYIADSYRIRKVSATSSMLNFTQATGTQTASVWNLGNSTLTLSSIALPNGYSQASTASSDCTASSSLAPGGFCTIQVTRASSAPQSAQLTLTDDSYNLGGNQQRATLALNGGSSAILVSPPVVTFARQAVGSTSYSVNSFTISNTGSANLTLASVSVVGANASDFSLSSCVTNVLLPFLNCSISVNFTPTGPGTRTASVVISSDAVNSAQSVTLTGTAVVSAFRMNIDFPNASHSMLAGVATVSGWAASNLTTVTNVTMAVDGVPTSASTAFATRGISRPDVCTAYPDSLGCPSVGWNFSLDTTGLPNGPHTLSVIATGANGTYSATSVPITVTNSLSRSPVSAVIDAPDSSTTYSGTVLFGGWALADYPISNVTVRVDGTFVATAAYGVLRPDVCTVFPGRPSCPYVGWNLLVDTTRYADGVHTLQITANAGGELYTTSKQFTIANSGSGIHATIDSPNAQSQAFAGSVVIGGWVFADTQSITSVIVKVDGQSLGSAPYGGSRPDVCQVFMNAVGCPAGNFGWSYLLNTGSLTNGVHTLSITAATGTGTSSTVAQAFTVRNATTSSATHVTIDDPSANASPQFGNLLFRGWALNDYSRITQVAITVDGIPFGFANYGTYRPDVCVAFPGRSGCPYVGWLSGVDTTGLTNGVHTLGVTATTGFQQYTESRSFTVSNWIGINPMIVNIDSPQASSPVSGVVVVGGWAINTMGRITSLNVSIDGVALGTSYSLNAARPDVCAIYSNVVDCPNVGWNVGLDTTTLPDGPHTITIIANADNGQRSVVTSPFITANASRTSIHMVIDSPSSTPVSGTITVSGWALDDAGTGVGVTILVDGTYRTVTHGNIARPDVCQVYPGRYACPNVGWNAALDTTQFANGTHVIEALGTSTTNARFTIGKTFTVAN